MRIATSTIYDQQTTAIDNQVANQANLGNQLSTGKALNTPSDDPTHIAQDLTLHTAIAQGNTTVSNTSDSTAELNTVDQALSSLTNIIQQTRSIAVQGASDVLSPDQRKSLAKQVDGLLTEAVGLANTNYAGKYVFAGTVAPTSPPVTSTGSPTSGILFNGNFQVESQLYANGQSLPLSTSIQAAFNFQSADNSPDVFQVLMNLRNSLQNGTVDDVSNSAVNQAGVVVNNATPLNSPNFKTPLVPDSTANVSFNISGAAGNVTFGPPAILPGSTVGAVVAAINAQTPATGVTAAFNPQTEKITLQSLTGKPFRIDDVASAGATNTANFTKIFDLNNQADAVGNISRQLGEIDHVLSKVLSTRATIGSNIQVLSAIKDQTSSLVLNNTKVQSGIEDADIAKVVGEFSQAQTVLQAAYQTTTRLESKNLFDYIQ
ncbi:MAG: flagellar hook-associated protein FlgL [Candidatus Eremiobacteraeota bacterium]|nr:flagellar hook-associated protein FlgL [Candidatus Eremiobacteraeota bacterium]